MINSDELKSEIKKNGTTQEKLAREIGIDPATINKKINEKDAVFTVDEAQKIAVALNLSYEKMLYIFFNTKLA